MPYPLPPTLSPSRVSAFTGCALAFRFAHLDRLPQRPSPAATRGTLVHTALEALYALPGPQRTPEAARHCLDGARSHLAGQGLMAALELAPAAEAALVDEAAGMVANLFRLEDPREVVAVGVELRLAATVGDVELRGVLDRLDRRPDGSFVVVDYKTGPPPSPASERRHLESVHAYALLLERVTGIVAARVELVHLGGPEPLVVSARTSLRTTGATARRVEAVWRTIRRANDDDAFAPRPGATCGWCSWARWCPVFGGDPEEARREGEERRAERAARREVERDAAAGKARLPFPAA